MSDEVKDILDIMNSDFKLWEHATDTPADNGGVTKTLHLPWGIGDVTVTMEGMTDAGKKREAVGAYGNYIRQLIDERINDDAVTARAKAAAARREPADGADSDSVSPNQRLRDAALQAPAHESASEAHERDAQGSADFGESLTARRAALRERIARVDADLTRWARELKGIEAAIAAMEDDEEDD